MGKFIDRFCPDMCVDHITDIDPAGLQARGFQAILLDLDNTLLPWQSCDVPEECGQWVQRVRESQIKLCILSNTHNPKRLREIGARLDVPTISRALKPRSRGFDRAANMLGCEPDKCVVVGDQVLTDVLGGNAAGMLTILVKPMRAREFIGTKFSRMIEWFILRRLGRLGRLGTKSDSEKSEIQGTK